MVKIFAGEDFLGEPPVSTSGFNFSLETIQIIFFEIFTTPPPPQMINGWPLIMDFSSSWNGWNLGTCLLYFHPAKTRFWNVFRGLYSLHQKKVYTFAKPSTQNCGGGGWEVGGVPHTPLSWSKLGQASFWNSKKWLHTNKERLPQTFYTCVAISWNFKMRIGPVLTNSKVGVAHPLPGSPWILSIWLWCKCIHVLSFGGDTSYFRSLFCTHQPVQKVCRFT